MRTPASSPPAVRATPPLPLSLSLPNPNEKQTPETLSRYEAAQLFVDRAASSGRSPDEVRQDLLDTIPLGRLAPRRPTPQLACGLSMLGLTVFPHPMTSALRSSPSNREP